MEVRKKFRGLMRLLLSIFVFMIPTYMIAAFDCTTVTDVPQVECEALITLYDTTDGVNWTKNTNWEATTTVGDWEGVTVLAGHINALIVDHANIVGPFPEALKNLSALVTLIMDHNKISGNIPATLSELTNLEILRLESNNLDGIIPASLGTLAQLKDLRLYINKLTGIIPPELNNLTELNYLHLGVNKLSGEIPDLGGLTKLTHLALGNNQLTGAIPASLGSLDKVEYFSLHTNRLTGTIPSELGGLKSAETVYLMSNQLRGSIPEELGTLIGLERTLNVSNNNLTGTIPASLKDLNVSKGTKDHMGLDIDGNKFTFTDIEPTYISILAGAGINSTDSKTGYEVYPQQVIEVNQTLPILHISDTLSITPSFTENTSGNDSYQWYKDGIAIAGSTSRILTIPNVVTDNSGLYTYQVTNSVVENLTLYSHDDNQGYTVTVVAILNVENDVKINMPAAGGVAIPNVTSNDTLDGNTVTLGTDVNITNVTDSTPYVDVNLVTGEATVSANTPAGTYIETYTVCEISNPDNCADANITVTVILNPDYKPVLTVYGGIVHGEGVHNFSFDTLVRNIISGSDYDVTKPLRMTIPKNEALSLTFDSSMTSFKGSTVQNNLWSFDASDPFDYIIVFDGSTLDARSRFALNGTLTVETGETGKFFLEVTIQSSTGGDSDIENNSDRETLEKRL